MATETDPRGEWDVIHPFGQKFVRSFTVPNPPDLVSGDTATWALYDAPGGTLKASVTSSAGIALNATTKLVTITVIASAFAGIAYTQRGTTYYHYFELLDSTGTPKLTMGGTFNYPPRERVPA